MAIRNAFQLRVHRAWARADHSQDAQRRNRRQGEEGASTVEFAVSVVALIMIVVGIMEMSLALYSYNFVSEAAREGSRYAMVRASCTSPCTAESATGIQTYVKGLTYPGIAPANITVTTVYSAYPAGTTCTPLSSCTNPGNLVTVTVQYQFPLSIPFMTQRTLTMSSSSAIVISQ
jgi:Flp pilus assembly protein TadG